MQYLETLSRMECQVYTLNRVYWDLHNRSEQLGHPNVYEKPQKVRKNKLSVADIGFSFLVGVLLGGVVYVVLGVISVIILGAILNWMYGDPEVFQYDVTAWIATYLPLIFASVGAFSFFVRDISDECKKIEAEKAKYQENLRYYESLVAADAHRVQKELEVKAIICAQRDAVLAEYWAARNALDALYNLNIIEGEYWDFAAVTTFYSYFRKEYCDRLAGPNQAYDRYDQALKIGEIINKLDVIINKLDEIIKNQAYLAELLRDSNNTLRRIEQGNEKMLQSMEAVEENSNLTEYNTRCAAESSKATALLTLFNTLKQNKDE